jgi:hypothetical protein
MNAFFVLLYFLNLQKKRLEISRRCFLSSILVVYTFTISDLHLLTQHLLHCLYIVRNS